MIMGGFTLRDFINMSDNRFVRQRTRKDSGNSLLNQLPPEVLSLIFSHLPTGKDLVNVSRVNKAFHEASQIDKIWQLKCWKETNGNNKFLCFLQYGLMAEYIRTNETLLGNYSVSSTVSMQFKFRVKMTPRNVATTYMQLYTKVLHKYGELLGLWQADITNYGGLVQVQFLDDKLVCVEWMAPTNPNYTGALRRQELFSIDVSEEGETRVLCLRGYHGPHPCTINPKNPKSFSSKCCNPDNHRHPEGKDEEFQKWLKEETTHFHHYTYPMSQELLLTKFLYVKQYENSYNFHRFELPPPHPKAIIQPGIFKGTYGDHGLELILLHYTKDRYAVKATKILGDPHVPAGQITFRADMRYSMVLQEEQQTLMTDVAAISRTTSVTLPENLPVQPFCVPVDCMDRDIQAPRQCKARFHGFGQIAGHGFTNSSYTSGHWIIFNEDLFGFLWLELGSLSMYHRVKEDLC